MRLPLLIIIFCYLLLIATDWLIITDLRRLSIYNRFAPEGKRGGRWWKAYTVFAVLVLALLTVAVCFPRTTAGIGISPAMWMIYIVTTVLISQIIYSLFSLLGFIPRLFKAKRWNTALWVGLPLGVLVFSMMWWGVLIGRHRIQVAEVEIKSSKIPESFDGYRIAQISDLHVGTWGNDTTFLSRLVREVNALKPDLIVFTGDIVNRESGELRPFLNTLSRLHASDGVLSVLGNHDYGDYVFWDSEADKAANLDSLKAMQRRMGWKLVDNCHLGIKKENQDSIIVIGVGNWGEPPFSRYGDLAAAYPADRLNDGNFKILLSHNPEHWNREVSKISNIDLTLAGHTHAMQIMLDIGNLRWSPSQYKYDQWSGLYTRITPGNERSEIYVNIGAGEVGIPMRIGADSEITLFTLKR